NASRAFATPRSPPYLARGLDNQAQLLDLLLDGDVVAVHRARKAALRRKRELLERRVASGFFDPALQIVLALELAQLRRDQPQHDRLSFLHDAKLSKNA